MIIVILSWLQLQSSLATDPQSDPKSTICVKRNFFNINSPIATDTDNFFEFVKKSDVYVDRSLLIKEVLEIKRPLVRITYPSKWGKSICLHMLKTFFELDTVALNNKSMEYPTLTKRRSYKYFVEGKIIQFDSNFTQELKNPPLISSYENIIAKYLGKYPVIYLNLSKCRGKNINTLLLRIKQAFDETYLEHSYLKDSIREKFDAIMIDSLLSNKQYNESLITESLRFLCRMLCKYNDKKAFIFIDGYDTVINEIYFDADSKFNLEDRKKVTSFLIKLLQRSFINNEYLEKGVITGTFEVLQHKCFNSTRYVKRYNLFNPSEFFAINEHEIEHLFHEINLPSHTSEKVIGWYGSYKMNKNQNSLFNPWSIAEFLKTKELASNWSEPPLDELLCKMMIKNDHVANTLKLLVQGDRKSISVTDLDFNEEELTYLSKIINGSLQFRVFDEKAHTSLLSYLWAAGYLTLSQDIEIIKSKVKVLLRIPNQEVSTAFSKYIDEFIITMNSTVTTSQPTEPFYYDTYVRPVILEKMAMRISHKPRAYNLI